MGRLAKDWIGRLGLLVGLGMVLLGLGRPAVALTDKSPDIALLIQLQQQLAHQVRVESQGTLASLTWDRAGHTLTLRTGPNWYTASAQLQDAQVNRVVSWAKAYGFQAWRVVDDQDRWVARPAVLGDGPVILRRLTVSADRLAQLAPTHVPES
ncbi:MAG: hypothetical protein IGQ88_07050 [Gloeomargaritaceae cyanobacterium C42_A2020_066]|nr:hypothetical protein [Gloeomargaritaceae cyanobacterium C42_A2020_066]